jgi:hypothetical protein
MFHFRSQYISGKFLEVNGVGNVCSMKNKKMQMKYELKIEGNICKDENIILNWITKYVYYRQEI